MGSSEIEETAGISHPLPPFLNNRSQRGTQWSRKPRTYIVIALRQSFLLEQHSHRLEATF